jgi:hypothetical protein
MLCLLLRDKLRQLPRRALSPLVGIVFGIVHSLVRNRRKSARLRLGWPI